MTGDDKIVEPPISEEALRRNETRWVVATMLIRAVGVSPPDGDEAWIGGVRRLYHRIMSEGFGAAVGYTPVLHEIGGQPQLDLKADDWVVWARMLAGKLDFENFKEVIEELEAERLAAFRPMPPLLAEGITAMRRGEYDAQPRRGRPPADERRNAAIWICFLALKLYGFQETRNPESPHDSACSIVADMVGNIGEDAVYKVIANWKRLAGIAP